MKAKFCGLQIARQNIIESKLCQISVMSQLNSVNTVGANLISNLISLAFAKLIFASLKTPPFSAFTPTVVTVQHKAVLRL